MDALQSLYEHHREAVTPFDPGLKVRYELLDDPDQIRDFMLQPVIRDVVLTDEELAAYEAGEYCSGDWSEYLGIFSEDELVGVIKYEMMTTITARIHPYLMPAYFKAWITDKETISKGNHWFAENTTAHKFVVQTPQCCTKVMTCLHKAGYELEGILTGGIIWRGKVENLIFMSKFIERGES